LRNNDEVMVLELIPWAKEKVSVPNGLDSKISDLDRVAVEMKASFAIA
jgi:hypothetical protein